MLLSKKFLKAEMTMTIITSIKLKTDLKNDKRF